MSKSFTLSLDQIEYEEYYKKIKVMNPLEFMTAQMETGLNLILHDLGVDCSLSKDEIILQQAERGIEVQGLFREKWRKANGFYVYQSKAVKDIATGEIFLDNDTLTPMGFVSEPKKRVNGSCYIEVQMWWKGKLIEVEAGKVPI
jgi:hypothetical protein